MKLVREFALMLQAGDWKRTANFKVEFSGFRTASAPAVRSWRSPFVVGVKKRANYEVLGGPSGSALVWAQDSVAPMR